MRIARRPLRYSAIANLQMISKLLQIKKANLTLKVIRVLNQLKSLLMLLRSRRNHRLPKK